jgi:hypothetical protein
MLDDKSKGLIRRHQTIANEMHMDFASFRTDENGVWLRGWRIVLSITSGGGLNAALRSDPSSETREGRMSQLSNRLHRIRGSAQVCHELSGMKVPSRWDRDKLCIDPFCRTSNLDVKFRFCTKKSFVLDHKNLPVCVVFSLMLNYSFKSFNSIEEDGRQVLQDQLVP